VNHCFRKYEYVVGYVPISCPREYDLLEISSHSLLYLYPTWKLDMFPVRLNFLCKFLFS
jgi:hypothetical protein